MNEDKKAILLQFIQLYKNANDKEAFITMWEDVLTTPDVPLTLEDAYNSAYGSAINQVVFEN